MPTVISNINLFVRDVARSKDFYIYALELEEDAQMSAPPSFVGLRAGSVTLTLQDASTPGAVLGSSQSVEIGFAVENVAQTRAMIIMQGGEADAVQQMGWGTACDARDPDGHRLTVFVQ